MNDLSGSIVVIIGGSSGIGLETARQAHAADARLILTGRDQGRLDAVRDELGASTATLDLADADGLRRFFGELPARVDHVLVSGGGPTYAPIAEMDFDQARAVLDEHLLGSLRIARECAARVRAGGSLTFITGTHARRPGVGLSLAAIGAVALPAIAANAALELAPMRVNAIAAGFVDTPLSARLLGDELEQRRERLRTTLPIRRVVGPADVAALALHLMTNTALTGGTYDVDGGQQLVP
ncbi:SDR family oxidoreductase [Nonomuraea sp. LPB2021202275-12-8]|uniref:SDR family oxidoreductase n=1 Tax=Nonomuraea sp. LPB2021202275-12-8 TaxID=3120159 RepID=UPI00300D3E3F